MRIANHYKFSKLQTCLISGIAVLCLIGLQFLGIAHEFSHDAYLKKSPTVGDAPLTSIETLVSISGALADTNASEIKNNTDSKSEASFGHTASTKDCQLFNGLALSTVIASSIFVFALLKNYSLEPINSKTGFNLKSRSCPYSAQAPPIF